MLGIDGKPEIEKYGVEPFIQKCKESVWKYKHEWEVMSDRVGYWADMDNPYVTYDDNYIESVWWSLKEIDKKASFTRDIRSFRIARAAAPLCRATRLRKATRMFRTLPPSSNLR